MISKIHVVGNWKWNFWWFFDCENRSQSLVSTVHFGTHTFSSFSWPPERPWLDILKRREKAGVQVASFGIWNNETGLGPSENCIRVACTRVFASLVQSPRDCGPSGLFVPFTGCSKPREPKLKKKKNVKFGPEKSLTMISFSLIEEPRFDGEFSFLTFHLSCKK